ncbi:fructose-6-phosphate aldolase [Syntrophothermus lipocalidus]|uniref:Probable transaldolase n=1 Tax=Syntrophothermus lipocalidus (strain DSM 12680 / TGB-C1) TaxID=643648 RepID=D7CK64_SYNLT|nr:fructose-6-phosphate aldolase [Syntrophothermus lipocalidus]ADI03048.1 transaldolase [Syntrophothermus lipocalidus DSM 12680]
MRIFIDSANVEEIKEINDMGFLAGVTTNPTLVAREGKDFKTVVKEICGIVDGPISAEVISMDTAGMIAEAQELAAIHPNVVIKIPMSESGLRAIRLLADKGIRTNATLVFSPAQALLAARAGASFVSPFIGRIDDTGNNGLTVLDDIVSIFNQYLIDTEIIAASIRHPVHVVEAAKIGAHIATVPYNVIKQMVRHPMTDLGIARFLEDWKKVRA